MPFENVPAFSPFPTMLSTLPKIDFNFWVTFILLSANTSSFDWSRILLFGKGLTLLNNKSLDWLKLKAFAED